MRNERAANRIAVLHSFTLKVSTPCMPTNHTKEILESLEIKHLLKHGKQSRTDRQRNRFYRVHRHYWSSAIRNDTLIEPSAPCSRVTIYEALSALPYPPFKIFSGLSNLILQHDATHLAMSDSSGIYVLNIVMGLEMVVSHHGDFLLVFPSQVRDVAHSHRQKCPGGDGTECKRGR